ncbi:MAG: tRNA epoxyqueuosine(34) reductase QueG [Acidobacteriota bacterium]
MSLADRTLVERLLEAGRRAGFVDTGIAPCEPSRFADRLDAWLARGAHGSMAWMARTADVRKDLRRKWTWARSALVGVAPYLATPRDRTRAPGLLRHVARYAWGREYHDVLRARLRDWAARAEQILGGPLRTAALVDTSAVLERELALRAGVGWIGRNTCLIGERGDSWRFIGVLLVDRELASAREPLAERCGSCRACLDACPTDAFDGPFELDARRCISYLTIEHRGAIAPELMSAMGDWLFGCDVCQEVCPWNRRVGPADDPAFAPLPGLAGVDLRALLAADEDEIRAWTRGSPLRRARPAGLLRNALIAAVHAGLHDDARRAARRLLDHEDEGVRAAAQWVLASPTQRRR